MSAQVRFAGFDNLAHVNECSHRTAGFARWIEQWSGVSVDVPDVAVVKRERLLEAADLLTRRGGRLERQFPGRDFRAVSEHPEVLYRGLIRRRFGNVRAGRYTQDVQTGLVGRNVATLGVVRQPNRGRHCVEYRFQLLRLVAQLALNAFALGHVLDDDIDADDVARRVLLREPLRDP